MNGCATKYGYLVARSTAAGAGSVGDYLYAAYRRLSIADGQLSMGVGSGCRRQAKKMGEEDGDGG